MRKNIVALVSGGICLALPISAHSADVRWMNLGNQKDTELVAYLAGVAVVVAVVIAVSDGPASDEPVSP